MVEFCARHSGAFSKITTAHDGLNALAKLSADAVPPDLILTDLSMPRLDGFELLGVLKQREETKQIPVFMFSSSGLMFDRERALAGGCHTFFQKPSTLAGLSEILREIAAVHPVVK